MGCGTSSTANVETSCTSSSHGRRAIASRRLSASANSALNSSFNVSSNNCSGCSKNVSRSSMERSQVPSSKECALTSSNYGSDEDDSDDGDFASVVLGGSKNTANAQWESANAPMFGFETTRVEEGASSSDDQPQSKLLSPMPSAASDTSSSKSSSCPPSLVPIGVDDTDEEGDPLAPPQDILDSAEHLPPPQPDEKRLRFGEARLVLLSASSMGDSVQTAAATASSESATISTSSQPCGSDEGDTQGASSSKSSTTSDAAEHQRDSNESHPVASPSNRNPDRFRRSYAQDLQQGAHNKGAIRSTKRPSQLLESPVILSTGSSSTSSGGSVEPPSSSSNSDRKGPIT